MPSLYDGEALIADPKNSVAAPRADALHQSVAPLGAGAWFRERSRGYAASWMASLSLPYRYEPGRTQWTRSDGEKTLVIQSGVEIADYFGHDETGCGASRLRFTGIPYGSTPRLVLVWLTTELVRNGSRAVQLGRTPPEFLRKLGIRGPFSGDRGAVFYVRKQLYYLLNSQVLVKWHDSEKSFCIIAGDEHRHAGWAIPAAETLSPIRYSRIILSEAFVRSVGKGLIEIDLDIFHRLRGSPIAMDIYLLLCSQFKAMQDTGQAETRLRWSELYTLMGSHSKKDKFVQNFRRALQRITSVFVETQGRIVFDRKALTILAART